MGGGGGGLVGHGTYPQLDKEIIITTHEVPRLNQFTPSITHRESIPFKSVKKLYYFGWKFRIGDMLTVITGFPTPNLHFSCLNMNLFHIRRNGSGRLEED